MKMLLKNGSAGNQKGFLWLLFLIFGLISNHQSDARAVNISNTWTLPHDGFTVFYRFFRDQISWFEADAVCQFHHANLVSVTNSVEFDASREFLSILDVTEPVWIGLMRSQNSDRFFWSNSKPLVSTTEYWAESLPVIDAPLCAVIDPIRDYRWHAFRCGGPETASFLCEMNVPSWAEECVIRDLPSLTIQYMADSGTVEITKDCGNDEGIIHQVCRGKQDLDRIINSLVCKNERIQQEISQIFSHERQNLIVNSDLLDSHKKSVEIIKNTQTDNNEDNNINFQNRFQPIEKQPEQETENPVQKLIEQFDVEELMQADQPLEEQQRRAQQQYPIVPEEITTTTIKSAATQKPSKRQNKKAKLSAKKSTLAQEKKKQRGKNIALEDMMMGDQPSMGFGENDDLNDHLNHQEYLPHTKKMLPQDLRHEGDDQLIKDKELNKNLKEKIVEKQILSSTMTTVSQPAIATTTEHLQKSGTVTGSISTDLIENENIKITEIPSASTANEDLKQSIGIISTMMSLAAEDNLNNAFVSTSDNSKISISSETPSIKDEKDSFTTGTSSIHVDSTDVMTTITTSHASVSTLTSGEYKPTPAVTIGHPMHPQQPRSNIITEETAHQHIKETNDNHFIPPMLMVKSHYQSPKSALGHNIEHQTDLQTNQRKIQTLDSDLTTLTVTDDNTNHHTNPEILTKVETNNFDNANYHNAAKNAANDAVKIISTENTENSEMKSKTTDEIISENQPMIVVNDDNIQITTLAAVSTHSEPLDSSTSTTLDLKSDASEMKLSTEKDNLETQQIVKTTTIRPNQKIEIMFSNAASTDLPKSKTISTKPITLTSLPTEIDANTQTTVSSSTDELSKISTTINTTPSLTSSLTLTSNDNIKDSIKIDEIETIRSKESETNPIEIGTENLSNTETIKIPPSSASNMASKVDSATILTTIVGTSSIQTLTHETIQNVDELSTTSTTVTNVDSKTFMPDNINNFTTAVSSSESDKEKQQHHNKQGHYLVEEHSVPTRTTTKTSIKTLVPTKKITSKKETLKKLSSSSSTSTSTKTISATSSSGSASVEEESEGHHDDMRKSSSDVYATYDDENFQPHKPNRKRILTKPESTSYLKKILG